MSTSLLLVLVVLLGFAGGHLLTRYAARFVMLSGAEYILVGVLIGPHFPWPLIQKQTLVELQPLFSLLLGLVGFVLGLQHPRARRFETALVGYVSSLLVLLSVAAVFLPLLQWLAPVDEAKADFVWDHVLLRRWGWRVDLHIVSTHLWVALGIGAAASIASPFLIERLRRRSPTQGPVGELLEIVAHKSRIMAVIFLGFVLSSARATESMLSLSMSVTEWIVAACAVGVVCGLLFGLFIGHEKEANRIFLATIGLVTFASGVGAALGISPLFMTLLAAVTMSATSSHTQQVRTHLLRLQHPLFVLVMIFAGTLWQPVHGAAWILPFVYAGVRFMAQRLWVRLNVLWFLHPPPPIRRLGNGLLSQGTLGVAIAMSMALRFPKFAPLILTTVLLGTLLSALFSRKALQPILEADGESTEPHPSAMLAPNDPQAQGGPT